MRDRPVAEIIAPNAEDENGEYWDPWTALGIHCGGYGAAVDLDALAVLRGIRDKLYNSDIAERAGLEPSHVELWQYIFCSANWCDYGTSPRGCFPNYGMGEGAIDQIIAAWEAYYLRHWNEPAQVDRSPEGQDAQRLGA